MSKVATLLAAFSLVAVLSSQVPDNEKFTLRIIQVDRSGGGCIVDARSQTIRYKLKSDLSAPCAMLTAGQDYKALRGISGNDPKDETKDTAILVVINRVENKRRSNAVFDIVSERMLELKSCPENDPLGIRSDEPCQPLPSKAK